MVKSKGCGKCGDACSKHRWDEEKNAWVRCDNANPSIFYDSINNIPIKYRTVKWEDFQQKNKNYSLALSFAQQVLQRISQGNFPKKSLIFTGKDFSGKTMLSSIVLRHLAIKGFSVNLVSLAVLTDLYFSSREEFHKYFDWDCIVVQLGTEITNNSSSPIIKELFKERFQKEKYTMFTSKLHVADMAKVYSKDLQEFFMSDLFKELQLR